MSDATAADAQSPSPSEDLVGTQVGKYKILKQLGRGGMGAVYEGIQEEIGQRVAIKVLHPELLAEQKFTQRFFDEARAISKVKHPGLIQIYGFDRMPDGTLYLVMELLHGELLWDRMERFRRRPEGGAFPPQDAARMVRQIASAFAAVHQNNIIHRDLKPENVFIVPDPETSSRERAKILDFGIARDNTSEVGRRTTTGVSIGTPGYMSPEQCGGASKLTDRSDVYSLGVIFYEPLAGKPPFEAETVTSLMRQHITKEPPPLPPSVSAEMASLALLMLDKEPEPRPSMQQVLEQLDDLGGQASRALPAAAFRRAVGLRRVLFRPAVFLPAAMAILGGMSLLIWLGLQRRPSSDPRAGNPNSEHVMRADGGSSEGVPKDLASPTKSLPPDAPVKSKPAAGSDGTTVTTKAGKKKKKGAPSLFPDRAPHKGNAP